MMIVPPENYKEMKVKIFYWNCIAGIGLTYLVAYSSPAVHDFLSRFDFPVTFLSLKIPIGFLAPSLVISIIAFAFELHNQVARLFRIRETFDIHEILLPLASGVNLPISIEKYAALKEKRTELMAKTFYRYASSKKPIIDPHSITRALDRWSWFWVFIEHASLCFLTVVILVALGSFKAACLLALWLWVVSLAASFAQLACAPLAHTEVREILADQTRRSEISACFSAL